MAVVVLDELTVHPVEGPSFTGGRLVLRDGRIAAVGPARRVPVPRGAQVRRYRGCHALPGFVDAHMHAGLHQGGVSGAEAEHYNETTDPVTPQLRAEDGINPRDSGFRDALLSGVTTVCVLPGSANVVGGLAVSLRTWPERIAQMAYAERPGMKVAFGENPCRIYREQRKAPATRMAVAAILRQTLERARAYAAVRHRLDAPRDLAMEALLPVIRRTLPLRVHAHRAFDLETALRVADEMHVRAILDHGTEAYLIADVLARRGVDVIVGPDMSARTKLELADKRTDTPARLHAAGVRMALMSDHPIISAGQFHLIPIVAARSGLPAEAALRAVTLDAAAILGLDGRVGSLKRGKDANVVVWSGPVLDAHSVPVAIYGEGTLVHGTEHT
ncbi:MAG: amidohydrolase family protein [Deltaproteobacteria bacterium]|nr:amidohydrolase family protein [Deltaproteobacteria bacterium]